MNETKPRPTPTQIARLALAAREAIDAWLAAKAAARAAADVSDAAYDRMCAADAALSDATSRVLERS